MKVVDEEWLESFNEIVSRAHKDAIKWWGLIREHNLENGLSIPVTDGMVTLTIMAISLAKHNDYTEEEFVALIKVLYPQFSVVLAN